MDRNDKLDFMLSRRSAGTLGAPGPTREQLERMLLAAGTVPDHGRLRPFRFAVIEAEGRAAFGDALARAAAERKPDMSEAAREGVRAKAFRSPTIIVLIASPKPGKIERWEQQATAACAGYAIVLAAHALGVGAVWKSVPFTRGQALTELFGLGEAEEMLGFIHLGTPTAAEEPAARPAIDLSALTIVIDSNGTSRFGS
ncbi:MAG: nitroreductase [Kofleriaceae bacterium]|nr:nitroreductase [Kofleriaceae bacterium]